MNSAMKDRYNESKRKLMSCLLPTPNLMLGISVLNVFFARSLASHLPPTSTVIVDSVNPGFCHSGLREDGPVLTRPFMWTLEQTLCRATTEGAKTLVWAALAGKNNASVRDQLCGAYTTDCRIGEPSDFAISQEGKDTEKRVWVGSFFFSNIEHGPDQPRRTRPYRSLGKPILEC
jgi:retinol dehydrogenase-12